MRPTLLIIVLAQFFCTSLWFAGNAIISELLQDLRLDQNDLANLTSAIQFGFITGTLMFAIFTISDRISPSRVFFISAVLAGIFNLGITISGIDSNEILLFRFLTGFFLAGIYPVGMKIASDYYQKGLGKSLGFLVGALVIGTSFPHLLKFFTLELPWKYVMYGTTLFSFLGGLLILLFVPNGPYRIAGKKLKFTAFISGFRDRNFRKAAFGYFGHMWELYTFWAFVPFILTYYNQYYTNANINVPLFSFIIIGSGSVACSLSGIISQAIGTKKLATLILSLSCLCCLLSPMFILSASPAMLLIFLIFWGLVVIADSPLFSTLVAMNAPLESKGSALTIVNCIGFSITIISIQFLNYFRDFIEFRFLFMLLAIGPILGLIALMTKKGSQG